MRIELVDQPGMQLFCDELRPLLRDPATTAFYAASAWVRRPGLALLKAELTALTSRLPAKSVRGLFGVDLGGTTVEGLESAMEVFGKVKVFHSPGKPRRTFHPKVYVAEQDAAAAVFIGSANLTYGGIGANFETVAFVALDMAKAEDRGFLQSVRDWYDRLWGERNAAVQLTAASLKALQADPLVWVPRESAVRKVLARPGKRPAGPAGRSLFSPVTGLPGLPKLPSRPPSPELLEDEQPATVVEGIALEDLVTAPDENDLRVLVAYVPHDRWKQVGFSKEITERFFRVFTNGDLMWIEGVKQDGAVQPARTTKLVYPSGSNQNHRIELPEPDGRPDPKPERDIVVVLERSMRTFRYVHLRAGDAAYQAMVNEITARPKFGQHNSPFTKRVGMSYGELAMAWPGTCPLKP